MTSDPVVAETQRTGGRLLPMPQKPKKRGHQAPDPDETPVVDAIEAPQATAPQQPHPPPPVTPSTPASVRVPAKQVTPVVAVDKGPAKTIYSDSRIDEFLHQVRVEATMARLDLTYSAVWRLAMHELMEHHRPAGVVQHFNQAASKAGQVGRPKR